MPVAGPDVVAAVVIAPPALTIFLMLVPSLQKSVPAWTAIVEGPDRPVAGIVAEPPILGMAPIEVGSTQ